MPIYEYVCPHCDGKFELLRRLSQADEEVSCPHCHNRAKRVLSTFASFSKGDDGQSNPLGGSSCTSCSATSCDPCHH